MKFGEITDFLVVMTAFAKIRYMELVRAFLGCHGTSFFRWFPQSSDVLMFRILIAKATFYESCNARSPTEGDESHEGHEGDEEGHEGKEGRSSTCSTKGHEEVSNRVTTLSPLRHPIKSQGLSASYLSVAAEM